MNEAINPKKLIVTNKNCKKVIEKILLSNFFSSFKFVTDKGIKSIEDKRPKIKL